MRRLLPTKKRRTVSNRTKMTRFGARFATRCLRRGKLQLPTGLEPTVIGIQVGPMRTVGCVLLVGQIFWTRRRLVLRWKTPFGKQCFGDVVMHCVPGDPCANRAAADREEKAHPHLTKGQPSDTKATTGQKIHGHRRGVNSRIHEFDCRLVLAPVQRLHSSATERSPSNLNSHRIRFLRA